MLEKHIFISNHSGRIERQFVLTSCFTCGNNWLPHELDLHLSKYSVFSVQLRCDFRCSKYVVHEIHQSKALCSIQGNGV